jgi:hypothetical protein
MAPGKSTFIRLIAEANKAMGCGLPDKAIADLSGYLSRRLAQADEVNKKWSNIALVRATCERQMRDLDAELEQLRADCPHLSIKGMEGEAGKVHYHCEACKAEMVE